MEQRAYQTELIDNALNSLKHNRNVMLCAITGSGKALDDNTPIRTVDGWKRMGDLKVGDKLFDENGKQCNVVGVFPQGITDAYKVMLSDGNEIVASGDHKWAATTRYTRRTIGKNKGPWTGAEVVTTTEMLEALVSEENGGAEWAIPIAGAIEHDEQELEMDPYILGLWLGDGTSKAPSLTASEADVSHYVSALKRAGMDARVTQYGDRSPTISFADGNKVERNKLANLGVLGNKHIPEIYLRASVAQRVALLKGLMDSDGYISKGGRAEFTSVNGKLAFDFLQLIRSLGERATMNVGIATLNGREIGPKYRVIWTPHFVCTSLPRKMERQNLEQKTQVNRTKLRYVTNIERVTDRHTTCIAVDSPNHLFLAGDALIPTHNTEMAFSIIREGGYRRVLFLVPGEVLLGQTASRAQGYGMTAACKWETRTEWDESINIMVVTATTAFNRMEQGMLQGVAMPDLVVVDEAHHCYTAVDKKSKAPRSTRLVQKMKEHGIPTVGLSATVWRLSEKQGFDEIFDDIYYSPSIRELSDEGYLAPLELIVPSKDKDRVHGGVVQNGEYTARGIESSNDSEIYTERAIQLLAERQVDASDRPLAAHQWRQSIIYAVSIGHAIKLANILGEHGIPTGFISSREPKEEEGELHHTVEGDRQEAVERFRNGELRVVVNYAIVTEGFDLASAEIALITRPTQSKALYRQMCGRAARAMDGKDKGIVIDCTDNWERFGGPMSKDHYTLEPRSRRKVSGEKTMFIYCNAKPKQIDGKSMGICASEIPNARTRECPACGESQGDICQRCNTWRRTTSMREINGRTVCGRCVKEEIRENASPELRRLLMEAARDQFGTHPVMDDSLRVVYDQMTATRNNPLSRHTSNLALECTPPMPGMHGIKEKNGRWQPYFYYAENNWRLGNKWYDNADEAMKILVNVLVREIKSHANSNVTTSEQSGGIVW